MCHFGRVAVPIEASDGKSATCTAPHLHGAGAVEVTFTLNGIDFFGGVPAFSFRYYVEPLSSTRRRAAADHGGTAVTLRGWGNRHLDVGAQAVPHLRRRCDVVALRRLPRRPRRRRRRRRARRRLTISRPTMTRRATPRSCAPRVLWRRRAAAGARARRRRCATAPSRSSSRSTGSTARRRRWRSTSTSSRPCSLAVGGPSTAARACCSRAEASTPSAPSPTPSLERRRRVGNLAHRRALPLWRRRRRAQRHLAVDDMTPYVARCRAAAAAPANQCVDLANGAPADFTGAVAYTYYAVAASSVAPPAGPGGGTLLLVGGVGWFARRVARRAAAALRA